MKPAEVQPRHYTPEDYFKLEEASGVRHEYIEGEVFTMAKASVSHNLLKSNLVAALRLPARKQGCRVFDERLFGTGGFMPIPMWW